MLMVVCQCPHLLLLVRHRTWCHVYCALLLGSSASTPSSAPHHHGGQCKDVPLLTCYESIIVVGIMVGAIVITAIIIMVVTCVIIGIKCYAKGKVVGTVH